MKCSKGKEIGIYRSAAGYYIGTWDEEGPYCRISEYYSSKEAAKWGLETGIFFERDADEIEFCNHGLGCIPDPEEDDEDLFDDFDLAWEIEDPTNDPLWDYLEENKPT